jgi:shikimate kinase/phosphoserine phosphatase
MLVQPLRIGIYGVSGAGKTSLSKRLSHYAEVINSIDGSKAIAQVTPGGLTAFKNFDESQQKYYRQLSLDSLQEHFEREGKHLLVTGHYCFFKNGYLDVVWTQNDAQFYDLIFLLQPTFEQLCIQVEKDKFRPRDTAPYILRQWMEAEEYGLSLACEKAGIPLVRLSENKAVEKIERQVIEKISFHAIATYAKRIGEKHKNIVLCDCDGTLNREDAFNLIANKTINNDAVTKIFKSYPEYCFNAFYEVSCLIETNREEFESIINEGLKRLNMNTRIAAKLNELKERYIVFISSGIPCAWKQAIGGVSEYSIIGGASFGRYGMIITNDVKEHLAKELVSYGCHVVAIGNASNDLGMLIHSSNAIVVFDQKPKEHLLEKLKNAGKRFELLQLA